MATGYFAFMYVAVNRRRIFFFNLLKLKIKIIMIAESSSTVEKLFAVFFE